MVVTLDEAKALDAIDPLAGTRGRFALPDGIIYLDGNSLGALPRATAAAVATVVERQWGDDLITSWNRHGWIDAPFALGAKLAPLIGARADEVLVCDSTSVNLYKLLAAALAAQPERVRDPDRARQFPDRLIHRPGPRANDSGGRNPGGRSRRNPRRA